MYESKDVRKASGDSSSSESEVQVAESSSSNSSPERGLVLSWRTSLFRSSGVLMMFKTYHLVHSLHTTAGIFFHVIWRKVQRKVSSGIATFYWVHAAYFGSLTILGTMLLWFSRDRSNNDIEFVDCIFNSVSALTATGLSSLRVRDFNTFGMVVLMLLMLLGSNVFTSLLPLYLRRFYFYRSNIRSVQNSLANVRESSYSKDRNLSCTSGMMKSAKISTASCKPLWHHIDHQPVQIKCPEFRPDGNVIYSCGDDLSTNRIGDGDEYDQSVRFSYGRVHAAQQRALEQQSLVALCRIIPLYMFGTLNLGFLTLICYNATASKAIRNLFEVEGVNLTFFAMFSAVSAFSNTGLSPLDENFVPFQKKPLVILPLAVLILAGNTMFPPTMRAIIWGLHWTSGPGVHDRRYSVYEYLLRYPRRCSSHLFPRLHTLWLVVTVVVINAVGAIAFCALDWHSVALAIKDWSTGTKIMAALFQSLNTRSAGMNIVALVNLSPPVLVLYVGMM